MYRERTIFMQPDKLLRTIGFLALCLGAAWIPAAASPPQAPVFSDFQERIKQYVKVRQAAPLLRTTKKREEIVDRRTALAQAIRESRPDAKQGDIFTKEISAQFLQAIQSTLHGSNSSNVRQTIRQGNPIAGVSVTVNAAYPEDLPLTTVPPTLLLRLPRLPERLAYRIVGHDFVLQDTEARLIVDFIPGAVR
jgi:hypothetical protein